jgi:hypothetical protein
MFWPGLGSGKWSNELRNESTYETNWSLPWIHPKEMSITAVIVKLAKP